MGSTSKKYKTPGTSTFILPYGATISAVECWAGGGRGASMTSGRGGGAGGGAYACPNFEIDGDLWNTTIQIIVGAGGNDSSINGGNSSVSYQRIGDKKYTVYAEAGGGAGCSLQTTTGGSGGSVVAGLGYTGGTGANGGATTSGGGGGGAGNEQVGRNAVGGRAGDGGIAGGGAGGEGVTGSAGAGGEAGNSGTGYGGGGGGAIMALPGTSAGGPGADGAVNITINWPDNVPLMILTDPELTN